MFQTKHNVPNERVQRTTNTTNVSVASHYWITMVNALMLLFEFAVNSVLAGFNSFFSPPGNIRNTEKLSYDRQQQYEIQVTAWDCGQKRALHSVPVRIDVKPVCKPGWQGGPHRICVCVQRLRQLRLGSHALSCVHIHTYSTWVSAVCVYSACSVIICVSLLIAECGLLAVCFVFLLRSHPSPLHICPSLACLPSPLSASLSLLPPRRNWTVKFSRRDQQHFTKSIVTQPTQLFAHQKGVLAALTRSRMMQRQVSARSITTTQAALEITAHTVYTCQTGQRRMIRDSAR